MKQETKCKLKDILSFILYLIFFPVCGIYKIIKDFKKEGCYYSEVESEWNFYIISLLLWIIMAVVFATLVYFLINYFLMAAALITIFAVIIFFIAGMPFIIYKICNKK